MPNRILIVVAGLVSALAVSACGGSDTPAASLDPGSLNPAFAKSWNGTITATATMPGSTPVSHGWQMIIAVSGANATVSRICADGSGTVTMSGSGNSASWTGSWVCPVMPFDSCAAFVFKWTSASVVLSSDNATLTAEGSGSGGGTGCGASSVTFKFVGT
jgi:hypothetical protein